MDKRDFELRVQHLNNIINNVKGDNCYDSVLAFFKVTCYLEDREREIQHLPLKGFDILGIRSATRKQAEAERDIFCQILEKVGRKNEHIRANSDETISKDNLWFGNIDGVCSGRISKFQSSEINDIQETVKKQVIDFLSSFKGCFTINWLR